MSFQSQEKTLIVISCLRHYKVDIITYKVEVTENKHISFLNHRMKQKKHVEIVVTCNITHTTTFPKQPALC